MSEQPTEIARLIPPAPPRHCQHVGLPTPDENVIPLGTLARCGGCERWFRHADTFSGDWTALSSWVYVRWFHFGLRRRIRDHLPEQTVRGGS